MIERVDLAPAGFAYWAEVVSDEEERELLARFETLEFGEVRIRGVLARRSALRYGMGYDYSRRRPVPGADPFPEWLVPLRDRAARRAGLRGPELVQALIQRYPAGAPIGWHRDSPSYETIVGVSLLSPARMRFRQGPREHRRTFEATLAPRSEYVLSGPVRWEWEHHVPPAKTLRYSITMRSLVARDRDH